MLRRLKKIRKFPSVATWALYLLVRAYSLLVFKRRKDVASTVVLDKFPFVTVTWHNRILFFPMMFSREIRARTSAVISASRDGEYLADIITLFGITPVRGSSRKKAFSALNDSLRQIESGRTVCFTPDGPRGPRYEMSKGPVVVASLTGVPVVPLSVNYSKYWELNTWDGFRIPKPFSTATVVIGEPMRIPAGLPDEDVERWRKILEDELNEIS